MVVRTVRLDEDTEKTLDELRQSTGSSVSALLKQGIMALKEEVTRRQPQRSAFEIYEELDLGPGGYATVPSTETRRGAQEAIRRKLKR